MSEYLDESVDSDDPAVTARFALTASNRALEAQDYAEAKSQAERGIEALPDDAFRTHYELAFNLHYALCEASCALELDLEEIDEMCTALGACARTRLERMMVITLLVWQLGSRGESRRAVDIGLDSLEEMGFAVRGQPLEELLQTLWKQIRSRIGLRSLADTLDRLEPSRDPELNAAMELFMALGFPLWVLDPALMSVLSMHMAHATLEKGTTPSSGLALASAGIAIVHGIGDRERGRKFGQAGITLAENLGHYVDETRQLVDEFIDNPNLGKPPPGQDQVWQRTDEHGESSAGDATPDEAAGSGSRPSSSALSDATEGPQAWYLRAIALCDAIRGEAEKSAWDRLAELPELMQRLEKYKETEPSFSSRYHLVCAEVARVYGDLLTAEGHYEHAIALATEHHKIHDVARANELAGCFFRDRGMKTPARAYLEEAHAGYETCGAVAKVAAMELEYSELLGGGARTGRERKSGKSGAKKGKSKSKGKGKSKSESDDPGGGAGSRKELTRGSRPGATSLERDDITQALERNDGVIARAARDLGVSRQSLYRRMNRLGIEAPGR